MLSETGRVVALDDEVVWVETLRQSACGKCAARSGCGHGLLNAAVPGGSRGLIKARLPGNKKLHIDVHDTVEISLPERNFLQGAVMLYLMPVVIAVVFAAFADSHWGALGLTQSQLDLRVGLATVAGLGVGFALVRWFSRLGDKRPGFQPLVTARVSS